MAFESRVSPDNDLLVANTPFDVAQQAAARIAEKSGVPSHDIALVLGSGWSGAADLLGEVIAEIDAATLPGFPDSGVAGHSGQLRSIYLKDSDKHALIIGARTHLYEGFGVEPVAHGVRTAAACGAKTVILTNGCGGIDPHVPAGTPVLIADHINLTATSPLEGATFVDLTDLYSQRLRSIAQKVDPTLGEGVYAQFRGPQYETPAEIRMARTLGADLVGMSTAIEAIAAREAGLEILGISLVTNLAAGVSSTPLSHEEVLAAGKQAAPRIAKLLAAITTQITNDQVDRE